MLYSWRHCFGEVVSRPPVASRPKAAAKAESFFFPRCPLVQSISGYLIDVINIIDMIDLIDEGRASFMNFIQFVDVWRFATFACIFKETGPNAQLSFVG